MFDRLNCRWLHPPNRERVGIDYWGQMGYHVCRLLSPQRKKKILTQKANYLPSECRNIARRCYTTLCMHLILLSYMLRVAMCVHYLDVFMCICSEVSRHIVQMSNCIKQWGRIG